ncbi:alpha/beta-hydrolase [Teratosphaeria nubilosa]|uniref:Alpha/beta-hydrolase n=1 Tax=Teratosphaeria nubilosa TaxID=161662 RepID=A0A6G1KTH6_9PEZI|nr:alpha/beta-hydrolase [Teratosphaeria nubilosa]
MPFLDRNGVQLHYEVHGEGFPLLLTHGYSSTSAMWQGQIAPLNQAGFKLITWDMRGHGKSTYPKSLDQYSEAATVADMAALLDEVSRLESQAIVGGLSLGGYMSLAFYRVHPQPVKTLLIIDTGLGYKSDAARDEWNKSAIRIGTKFDQEGLEQLRNSTPERAQVTHRNAKGLALAARGMLAQRNAAVINSLPDIKVPTLVVVGADDKPYLAASEYMAKKIPGTQAFNQAVIEYLRGLRSVPAPGRALL